MNGTVAATAAETPHDATAGTGGSEDLRTVAIPAEDGGLTQAEVRERVLAGEVNVVPRSPGRGVAQILRANVATRFNAILGALFVLVIIVGPLQDALFGVVLAVNTGIGVAQEIRAKRALDRLAILSASRARVLRDGTVTELDPGQVVRDDVLELRRGDQVPVDAVILAADGLELDEALLTGEAEPVPKEPGGQVLSGSFVVAGSGRARVTAVGGHSYAAALQAQARRFSLIRSELQQGTNQILRLVTWVMIPAGVLLVLSELLRSHQAFADAVRGSVAGVVGMVPEGLVLLTSVAFAVGALRLARRRVLVCELAAIEGLARVDVLCIDKTGTLTRPGMRLAATEPITTEPITTEPITGGSMARIGEVLAAVAAADREPNATMLAIAASYPRTPGWMVRQRVPFSSARKWSGVSFADHGTWLLGAPGVIGGDLPPASAASVARHEAAGRRVLLLASGSWPRGGGQRPVGAEPVALLVLTEELRDEATSAVRYLAGQGVRIKVLSGDAPAAVAAIARRAGIPAVGAARDASALADEEMAGVIAAADIFGRVRPAQKLAAVRALQAAGHVVAMVGDGVNDVQALKQADLGIAIGSGSDASRSVARVVLLDGTFAAIPQLLDEARRVIANIERVARLFVTKTVYAAIIAILVGAAGIAYPFFPRHLTIISTLTIGVPGFFLALAAGAPRARAGFTRRVLAFTIPAGIAAAAAALGGYAVASAASVSAPAARTAAMLALLAVGLWVLGIVARRAAWRVALVAAMAACLVPLFAVPLARTTFDIQFPSVSLLPAVAGIVIAAIAGLTAWRHFRPSG